MTKKNVLVTLFSGQIERGLRHRRPGPGGQVSKLQFFFTSMILPQNKLECLPLATTELEVYPLSGVPQATSSIDVNRLRAVVVVDIRGSSLAFKY